MANLLRLIQKMKPKYLPGEKKKKKKNKEKDFDKVEIKEEPPDEKNDIELKRQLYPGLAIPDNPNVAVSTILYIIIH